MVATKEDKMKKQYEHLARMQAIMQRQSQLLHQVDMLLPALQAALPELKVLVDYYGDEQWMRDFEADELGLIPVDVPRGALSEDGIEILLDDTEETARQLQEFAKQCLCIVKPQESHRND